MSDKVVTHGGTIGWKLHCSLSGRCESGIQGRKNFREFLRAGDLFARRTIFILLRTCEFRLARIFLANYREEEWIYVPARKHTILFTSELEKWRNTLHSEGSADVNFSIESITRTFKLWKLQSNSFTICDEKRAFTSEKFKSEIFKQTYSLCTRWNRINKINK